MASKPNPPAQKSGGPKQKKPGFSIALPPLMKSPYLTAKPTPVARPVKARQRKS